MASEHVLTHPFLRPGYEPQGEDERRRKALSRTTSTVLAAALHVLFFLFFVFAVHPFDMRSKPIIETFLTLPVPGNNLPERKPVNPQPVVIAPPRIESSPIQIPKPPPIVPDQQQRDKSGNPAPPTDILGAVGRELACSAGSWEHLSSAERARCGLYPWRAARLPNGSLVMLPPNMLPRLKENPNPQYATSGAAQMQSDLARGYAPNSGGCPILQNTPCLHPAEGQGGIKILGGDN